MNTTLILPLPVERALRNLGRNLQTMRIKRHITISVMAERVFISRQLLSKIEKGDPSVSLGAYANVLFVLGLENSLAELVDVRYDELGLQLIDRSLPKHVCKNKKYF